MIKLYQEVYNNSYSNYFDSFILQYDYMDADIGAYKAASEYLEVVMNTPLEVVNLMYHEVNYVKPDGSEVVIPPSGIVARCKEVVKRTGFVNTKYGKIPVVDKKLFEVENLPKPSEDKIYLVSLAVKKALGDSRPDVFAMGETRRDDKKRINGFYSLSEGK